ncbi:App1 family protein [Microvirga yunnanensis]|uniref:App1 family protein n=1 Tax=Microvirga yunnanensis TaxID=2953740 RepID=UPI0021C67F0E|nr:phosphatase domain-containing protein [Microvirga sp. HBU65207]
MSGMGTAKPWLRAFTRISGLIARPVREAQGESGVVLQPYRGYGSPTEVFLIGRVFRQSKPSSETRRTPLLADLRDIGRRIARRAVPNADGTARFYGAEEPFTTDQDGYFRVHLSPALSVPDDRWWHTMDLALEQPQAVQAQAQIFIPPASCRYVVISDIDDTIMYTGVANKLRMLWRLFVEDAKSRMAFPGVGALYRALHAGTSGHQQNPMLYVSRAPWGIYEVLEEFFDRHGIPVGPILFLREWGVSWTSPLPHKAEDHKRELIHNMLALYRDLPFVLIGDSGQHDPEIYRQIVDEHPGRVLAVYIRNVSRDPKRIREIEDLAKVVAGAGSSLVLAADSLAMAGHAVGLGLIAPATLSEVKDEKAAADTARRPATHGIQRATPAATADAVSRGDLQCLVETGSEAVPPSVVVEPKTRRPLDKA